MVLDVGDEAPGFDLPADGGGRARLADFRGRPLVLYFYPKDDTSGCTREALDFAGAWPLFQAAGVALVGVSKDGVASHDRFKAKHGLPFALASDESGAVVEAYGSWVEKSMYGRSYMGIDRFDVSDRRQGRGPRSLAQGQGAGPRGCRAGGGAGPRVT